MLSLPSIFSSGALYQANAPLTVHGRTDPAVPVTVRLSAGNGTVFSEAAAESGPDGSFSAVLTTPEASFAEYVLTVAAGEECHTAEHILFGELWLASGQSNMELTNVFIPDAELLYDAVAGKKIRVFSVSYDVPENRFPWEPDEYTRGEWIGAKDRRGLSNVSAMGLKFVEQLYDALNRDAEIPVGFLNASWGGTPISGWLPRDAVLADEGMKEIAARTGCLAEFEKWNTRGDLNFQQPAAQYNLKIAPLHGVKVRGAIWYQGENECGGEFWTKTYADWLRLYQKVYAERFGADPARFMMICSLIYPWTYGPSGECNLGYLNDAFVTVAKEAPDKFIAVPIGDLEPDWAFTLSNHPIHPTNKYPLAVRTAKLALANIYENRPEAPAIAPAVLESWKAEGGGIRLVFKGGTGPLRVGTGNGERIRGLYVAGENGVYLPAEVEILSYSELFACCPEIPAPVHAAYGIQSMEPKVNLFAGDYPVLPFFTDRENYIKIEARPWYDPGVGAAWASKMRGDLLDLFFRPVWLPLGESEVCPDTAFRCCDAASLRIEAADGNRGVFGTAVRSYPYQRLDFGRFGGMRVHLWHTDHTSASLALISADGTGTVFPFRKTGALRGTWEIWEATFDGIPEDAEFARMEFRFEREGENFRFVNLEHPRLFFREAVGEKA